MGKKSWHPVDYAERVIVIVVDRGNPAVERSDHLWEKVLLVRTFMVEVEL